MPSRDEIATALDQARKKDSLERRLKAIARLLRNSRTLGYALLDHDAAGQPINRMQRVQHKIDWNLLDSLSWRQRIELFTVLFPGIGPEVEKSWQFQKKLPYLLHGQRRAFRAPQQPALTLMRRLSWLQMLLFALQGYEEQDILWFAQHAGYIARGWGSDQLGLLFAAAIDAGGEQGDQVFTILCETATGEAEVGVMARQPRPA